MWNYVVVVFDKLMPWKSINVFVYEFAVKLYQYYIHRER